MTNIRTALEQALQQLHQYSSDEPRLEAEILLCHLLNKNRAYLFAHPDSEIASTVLTQYQQLIKQRTQGMPIAYITGTREFWSLSLKVTPHTLIPRHETERLIELTLELVPEESNHPVLDLGTGSGAIALALAKERPHWTIIACDRSEEALHVARENARHLGINNVHFYHSNWFSAVPNLRYQAIVSNPPYIAEYDPHLQEGDLRFEPYSALASSQDGLADLQCIIEQSYNKLLPGGLLLLEHGYDQKIAVSTILNRLGYKNIRCWQDIQGHDRVSGGCYPESSV